MPDYLFRLLCRRKPLTFDTVDELRNRFKTSRTATAIRLVEMGYGLGMVVCHSWATREWYAFGPDLPFGTRPLLKLSANTQAYGLLNNGQPSSEPTVIGAESWIDAENADEYALTEHSVKVADSYVVSLLWWHDEKQLGRQ